MRILFSVFRYHTNMVPMICALQNAGHEIMLLVVAQEAYEDQLQQIPQKITLDNPLEPQISAVFDYFRPDVVVVRNALNKDVAPIVARFAKTGKTACFSYEQNPCYAQNRVKAIYKGLRHLQRQFSAGLPVFEISPKRGSSTGYRIPFRQNFQLPIKPQKDAYYRDYCPDGLVRVVAVGKLGSELKRLHWVIEALEGIDVDYRLTLVGANDVDRYPDRSRAYYEMLYERTQHGRSGGYIEIKEDVPYSYMPFIYRNSDVFVLPAEREKFGVAPLEAMSHGCAVICTDNNGSSECLSHLHDAVIFNANLYEDFFLKLEEVLVNRRMIERLGRSASLTIRKKHSLEEFAKFFESLFSRGFHPNRPAPKK